MRWDEKKAGEGIPRAPSFVFAVLVLVARERRLKIQQGSKA
jgi:hypothetical protein